MAAQNTVSCTTHLLADKNPGIEGDAGLLYALVCAEPDRSQSKWISIITESQRANNPEGLPLSHSSRRESLPMVRVAGRNG